VILAFSSFKEISSTKILAIAHSVWSSMQAGFTRAEQEQARGTSHWRAEKWGSVL